VRTVTLALIELITERLLLRPLPVAAARALPGDRAVAAAAIGAALDPDWPQPDLLDVLPHQSAPEHWGVWVIVENSTGTVVGDLGFFGPPDANGEVEIGFAVVPSRRRRGYAVEAGGALIAWARARPEVTSVRARCEPGNAASIATLTRIGLLRGPEVDGLVTWS
jgi:ribosomal-protein-alanine N-acetyltransferase